MWTFKNVIYVRDKGCPLTMQKQYKTHFCKTSLFYFIMHIEHSGTKTINCIKKKCANQYIFLTQIWFGE